MQSQEYRSYLEYAWIEKTIKDTELELWTNMGYLSRLRNRQVESPPKTSDLEETVVPGTIVRSLRLVV